MQDEEVLGDSGSEVVRGERDTVRVAILSPLSADNPTVSSHGRAIVNAAQLGLRDRGEGGIDLQVYDTGGDAGRAAAVARRALDEGAALILGPLFGANTRPVGSVAASAGVPVISFSTDSSVAGGPVYISGFVPENDVVRILDYASRRGIGSVAVYSPETPYGDAALRGLREAASRSGIAVVATATYPRSFQDIQRTSGDFARSALDAGAEAVLLPDSGEGLKIVGSFLDFHGVAPSRVQYLGLGQWESSATLTEPALRRGWFAGADPDAVDEFARRYSAVYGEQPPFVAVLGYDAAQVAAELVAEARVTGARNPFSAERLTRPEGFDGALGAIRFGRDGRAERGLAVLEVGVRSFDVLEPAPARFGAGS